VRAASHKWRRWRCCLRVRQTTRCDNPLAVCRRGTTPRLPKLTWRPAARHHVAGNDCPFVRGGHDAMQRRAAIAGPRVLLSTLKSAALRACAPRYDASSSAVTGVEDMQTWADLTSDIVSHSHRIQHTRQDVWPPARAARSSSLAHHRPDMTFSNRDFIEASFAMRFASLRIWFPAGLLGGHCWALRWAQLGGHQAPRPSNMMRGRAFTSASLIRETPTNYNKYNVATTVVPPPPSTSRRSLTPGRARAWANWIVVNVWSGRVGERSSRGECSRQWLCFRWFFRSLIDVRPALRTLLQLMSSARRAVVDANQMPSGMVLAKKTWSRRRWDGEIVRISASSSVHECLKFPLTERWSTRQDTSESTAQSGWLLLICRQDSQNLESWQDLIGANLSMGWPMGRKKPIDGLF